MLVSSGNYFVSTVANFFGFRPNWNSPDSPAVH